jgi:hypothetical protein
MHHYKLIVATHFTNNTTEYFPLFLTLPTVYSISTEHDIVLKANDDSYARFEDLYAYSTIHKIEYLGYETPTKL